MNEALLWMETSAPGQLMRDVPWLFPTAEIFHFLGLCLLLGSLLVVDFRLIGFSRDVSIEAVHKFLPITATGFSINLVTGTLFFFADPFRYYQNIAFQLKMALVLLAGINVLLYVLMIRAQIAQTGALENNGKIKSIATLSLVFWFGVIILGRFIPYVE